MKKTKKAVTRVTKTAAPTKARVTGRKTTAATVKTTATARVGKDLAIRRAAAARNATTARRLRKQGMTIAEIATKLACSVSTVGNYLRQTT